MSQITCPNGHLSNDPDWCDTCGARLGAAPDPNAGGASPAAPATGGDTSAPTPAPAASLACPHCGAANVADALFCEDCGYDFTTGQAPDPLPDPAVTGSTPVIRLGDPQVVAPTGHPDATVDQGALAPGPPGWIVILEVDKRWFELKGTLADQPCPPPSSSTIPLGQAVVRIGRSSQSRGIHPEIALDRDTAVSRQHAQLIGASTSGAPDDEHDAYAVVDLGSTNGTFVVRAGAEPDAAAEPIVAGVATVLADGDQVYLGAWTRLTLRHTG